jgi:hypothetical protein
MKKKDKNISPVIKSIRVFYEKLRSDIESDIFICNEKKLCVFCHNPASVLEFIRNKKALDNLFICLVCYEKARYFKEDFEAVLLKMETKPSIEEIEENAWNEFMKNKSKKHRKTKSGKK